MKTLHEKLGKLNKTEVILDVRGRDEYAEGHVPGAINIPHDEVSQHATQLKSYEKIYIHCRSGKRAQIAFADLEKQGLKNLVCISTGGMLDWIEAGYEIKKGS
jgi:rhodanese-related sulfurtransferase